MNGNWNVISSSNVMFISFVSDVIKTKAGLKIRFNASNLIWHCNVYDTWFVIYFLKIKIFLAIVLKYKMNAIWIFNVKFNVIWYLVHRYSMLRIWRTKYIQFQSNKSWHQSKVLIESLSHTGKHFINCSNSVMFLSLELHDTTEFFASWILA